MDERKTEITVNVYAGVPFNNKYKDVLFVTRETLATYLAQFEIGQTIIANRFEIIDDAQAVIDLTNNFECMNANYCKVHRTIMPESNENVYEFDSYYFVNRARQIATNVIRLYLELDVFQTQFNKYDFQKKAYEIPKIRNSRCILSNSKNYDFDKIEERMSLTPLSMATNADYSAVPIWKKTGTLTEAYAIMHYVSKSGEFVAISKNTMALYENSTNVFPYSLSTLINSIYSKDKFFVNDQETAITVLNLYLIPKEYLDGFDHTNLRTGAFHYTDPLNHHVQAEYWVTENVFGVPEVKIQYMSTTINFDKYDHASVGTYTHQIDLENNTQPYWVGVRMVFASDFQMLLIANKQIIDVAQDFEYSVFESELGAYIANNKNGLAIKGVSNALNMVSAGVGIAQGNPTALLGIGKSITSFAGDLAEFADLGNKPLKLLTESNLHANLYLLNGIGIFKWHASNKNEIQKNAKYYGDKIDYLANIDFIHRADNTNFEYFQFANVEIIGKVPQTFMSQIEQMFLTGVRIWYNPKNYLNTIEPVESTSV